MQPDYGASLRKYSRDDVHAALNTLETISIGATKEVELQTNLHAMIDDWRDIKFPIGKYKDTDLVILANYDDIQVMFVLIPQSS